VSFQTISDILSTSIFMLF